MPMWPVTYRVEQNHSALLGGVDLLPRHPVFRARDLELARVHLSGALAPNRLTYLTGQHRLNLRHRCAKLGAVAAAVRRRCYGCRSLCSGLLSPAIHA